MKTNHDGFTLVELVIAIVLIVVLACVAVPNYFIFQKKSEYNRALNMVKTSNELSGEKIHRFIKAKLRARPLDTVYDIVKLKHPEVAQGEKEILIILDPDLNVFLEKIKDVPDERIVYETSTRLKIIQAKREVAKYKRYINKMEERLPE